VSAAAALQERRGLADILERPRIDPRPCRASGRVVEDGVGAEREASRDTAGCGAMKPGDSAVIHPARVVQVQSMLRINFDLESACNSCAVARKRVPSPTDPAARAMHAVCGGP